MNAEFVVDQVLLILSVTVRGIIEIVKVSVVVPLVLMNVVFVMV